MLKIAGQYFSLLQLCSSDFFLASGSCSRLPYSWSPLLPLATHVHASQPLLGYFWLLSFWLLSAQPWLWFPPPWHGSCCWPALPCWGIAPGHNLPHFLPWGSADDQNPGPPGSLRCVLDSPMSEPSESFILVFSAWYNYELDSPWMQHQHPCLALITGSIRLRSLSVPLMVMTQGGTYRISQSCVSSPVLHLISEGLIKELAKGPAATETQEDAASPYPTTNMIRGEKSGQKTPEKQKTIKKNNSFNNYNSKQHGNSDSGADSKLGNSTRICVGVSLCWSCGHCRAQKCHEVTV